MSPNGVDQAGAEVVVQRGAAEQQAVEDGPKQELVDQADSVSARRSPLAMPRLTTGASWVRRGWGESRSRSGPQCWPPLRVMQS
jgi:hypothetical protein